MLLKFEDLCKNDKKIVIKNAKSIGYEIVNNEKPKCFCYRPNGLPYHHGKCPVVNKPKPV